MYSETFRAPDFHKKHIKASQNATVRLDLDKTPEEITGLATDGATACITVIVISKDKRKFSLTHTDLFVKSEALIKECEWAGEEATIYFIGGLDHKPRTSVHEIFKSTMLRFRAAIGKKATIDMSYYDRNCWAVAINRHAKITTNDERSVRFGRAAPEAEVRHAKNFFDMHTVSHVTDEYHDLDLQFNGNDWTDITPLSETATSWLQRFIERPHAVPPPLVGAFNDYVDYRNKAFEQSKFHNSNGVKLFAEEKFSEAALEYKLALQLYILKNGEKGKAVTTLAKNLGLAYYKSARYSEALPYFRLALDANPSVIGPEMEHIAKIRDYIAECTEHLPAAAGAGAGGGASVSSEAPSPA